MQISIYGCRGSIPACGAEYARFGGATSCVGIRFGDEEILLDAGSGLLNWQPSAAHTSLLLSHTHVDHILGLLMAGAFQNAAFSCTILGAAWNGVGVRDQLALLFREPIWPITPAQLKADLTWRDLHGGEAFSLGSAAVETLAVPHPNGCLAYRICAGGKTVVYATDTELDDGSSADFSRFADGCDLLFIDAQYTAGEGASHRGFGHNTIPRAIAAARECHAARTVLTHHSPFRTDGELLALEAALPRDVSVCFARAGMRIEL